MCHPHQIKLIFFSDDLIQFEKSKELLNEHCQIKSRITNTLYDKDKCPKNLNFYKRQRKREYPISNITKYVFNIKLEPQKLYLQSYSLEKYKASCIYATKIVITEYTSIFSLTIIDTSSNKQVTFPALPTFREKRPGDEVGNENIENQLAWGISSLCNAKVSESTPIFNFLLHFF